MREIGVSLWDAITTPQNHLVIVINPVPRPRGIILDEKGVVILTHGLPLRLNNSCNLSDVVRKSASIVIAEAHEHIVRETLVRFVDRLPDTRRRIKERERNTTKRE